VYQKKLGTPGTVWYTWFFLAWYTLVQLWYTWAFFGTRERLHFFIFFKKKPCRFIWFI